MAKLRSDRKIEEPSNNEVSLVALHRVIELMENFTKKEEIPSKTNTRINQEKEMERQLAGIRENM